MAASSAAIVLIVEDELLVREYAADMLEAAGYIALQVRDADEAIAILEARDDIRLVFTDMQMPGSMDGLRLAEVVRNRWPPVELIITSGQPAPKLDRLPARAKFLPKPYSDTGLVGAIAPMLE